MKNKLEIKRFNELLNKVILPADKVILIYSGIWTFGHRFKLPPTEVANSILNGIEEVVGPHKTIMLPTYTYVYNKLRKYDVLKTTPETGILPKLFLKRRSVQRTKSAISSFAVKGPLTETLVPIMGESIWGKGSLLEWMEKQNIRIITLGLPWALSCGYLHRIEEVAQVPYRYYKKFPGKYVNEKGIESDWAETMYVRPLNVPSLFKWNIVSDLMERREQLLSGSEPGIKIESCLSQDLMKAGLDLVASDPYALVSNTAIVREWVENGGKKREIEELEKNIL
ncbi:MAG: AAC(3) family N-acetyltransferase [Oligoflexia bacterium]|nr:AAC(3) family N-acetyltransferase [Oligoflexia bacterium]